MVERARRERSGETAPDVQVVTSTVSVYTERFGEKTEQVEPIQIHKFVTDPAYVRINAGVTKQTAPYEALRIDVAVSMPCYREQINEMQEYVAGVVAERLQQELDAYMGGE